MSKSRLSPRKRWTLPPRLSADAAGSRRVTIAGVAAGGRRPIARNTITALVRPNTATSIRARFCHTAIGQYRISAKVANRDVVGGHRTGLPVATATRLNAGRIQLAGWLDQNPVTEAIRPSADIVNAFVPLAFVVPSCA